jgi:hypothetical protein
MDYIITFTGKEGALIRESFNVKSEFLGYIPINTIIKIVEKITVVRNGENCVRLRIKSPEIYKGWIDENEHICKPCGNTSDTTAVVFNTKYESNTIKSNHGSIIYLS